jgi:2-haloalkanoic acid dehalogenase type II
MGHIKAVLFDFMGTCLDWHSTITEALPPKLSYDNRSKFAVEWRQAYFDYNAERLEKNEPIEDFDETQRRVLGTYLEKHGDIEKLFTPEIREDLVKAWHRQKAWPDVADAIRKLRHERGYEVFVHANGSTRLQLDIARSAGLQFDLLISSEMLGTYKPGTENYLKAMQLLKLKPEECVTVAAHAYDTRGAKAVGMKTVYVYRWSDDILEIQEKVKKENDAYLTDMTTLDEVIATL